MKSFTHSILAGLLRPMLGLHMAEDTAIQVKGADGMEADIDINDILGIEMEDVEEYRAGPFPIGVMQWRIKTAELTKVDAGTPKVPRACFVLAMECTNVVSVKDNAINTAQLIGRVHNERIFVIDLQRAIGEFKAFCNDVGLQEAGLVPDLLNRLVGLEFQAPISHQQNRDNPERPYVNLNRDKGKILPLTAVA